MALRPTLSNGLPFSGVNPWGRGELPHRSQPLEIRDDFRMATRVTIAEPRCISSFQGFPQPESLIVGKKTVARPSLLMPRAKPCVSWAFGPLVAICTLLFEYLFLF